MMGFAVGDHVRFKGDPDEVEYRVTLVNGDSSVDIMAAPGVGGYHPEFVPQRLLDLVPRDVEVGDVYRGKHGEVLYFVVGHPDERYGGFLVFDNNKLFGGLRRYGAAELQNTENYELVSEFGLKSE